MPLTLTCAGCRTTLRVKEEYVGKQVKCPRCSALMKVPAGRPEEEDVPVVEAVEEGPAPAPARGTRACPACGWRIPAHASKCKFCKAWVDDDDEEDEGRGSEYKPCPRCRARGARRVLWTFWGSFYGPALFSHVECPKCGATYNGRTGRSNLVPAVAFVSVPLLLILLIVGFILVTLARF
jgi:hypothetical protein